MGFPRLVSQFHERFKSVKEMYPTYNYILTLSAVEFYLCMAYDLLYERTPAMDDKGFPIGANCVEIKEVSDLIPFLDDINKNRSVAATKMNEGSSRSHCALILTSWCFDPTHEAFMKTSFTMLALAGSERASKTGAKGGAVVNPQEIIMKLEKGGELKKDELIGAQGSLINWDL